MTSGRLARLAVACVLFGASLADAEALQAPLSNLEIQIVVRSDSGPIPRAQIIVRGNTTETLFFLAGR